MKQIKLKILGTKEQKDFMDYKVIIKMIAESPQFDRNGRNMGLNVAEVRKALRILKALNKASDMLILEDADYNILKKKAQDFKWSIASENIAQFMDDIDGAQEIKKE